MSVHRALGHHVPVSPPRLPAAPSNETPSGCFESAVRASVVKSLHPPLLPPDARSAQPFPRPTGANVLLALSAGAGSSALADLVHERYVGREGEVRDTTRGLREAVWERGWAVHIDFSAVTGLPSREGLLREFAEERGLRFVCVRAEGAFDPLLRRRVAALAGADGGSEDAELVAVRLDEPGEWCKRRER